MLQKNIFLSDCYEHQIEFICSIEFKFSMKVHNRFSYVHILVTVALYNPQNDIRMSTKRAKNKDLFNTIE